MYHQGLIQFGTQPGGGPDPHDWDWVKWIIELGPLLGFGFLAGATLDLPDDPGTRGRGLRGLLSRRSIWVVIGPWWGFLVWAGLLVGFVFLVDRFPQLGRLSPLKSWEGTLGLSILSWALTILFFGTYAYGWLWPAWVAMRRSSRLGRWRRALMRGLITALAFVGSLFGTFWAITSAWRSYFFDPRVVPVLVLALGLATMCGCASTITYGEVRRRELFHAMLVAWVLGLALMWRWWSRRRPGAP
jgi:hypothetical protein